MGNPLKYILAIIWLGISSLYSLSHELEEVHVIAGKSPIEIRKADFSVTIAGRHFLQQFAIGDLLEVSRVMPNMRIEGTSHSSPQVFVRGFGTNSFNPSFEPAVGIVVDGVYMGRPTHLSESMFDVHQIELLRGPQGTLFGKNTIAGVLNISTVQPDPSQPDSGYVYYKEQAFGEQRLELASSYSTDSSAFRLSGLKWTRQGRIKNTLLERKEDTREQYAWRLAGNLALSERSSSTLKYQRSSASYNFWPRQLLELDNDTETYLTAFDPAVEGDPLDYQTTFDNPGRMHIDSQTAGLVWTLTDIEILGAEDSQLALRLGWNELDFWQYQDIDISPAELIDLDEADFYRQSSAEFTFSSSFNSLFGIGEGATWLAGAYYFTSVFDINLDVIVGRDAPSYATTTDAQQLVTDNGSRPFAIGGVLAQYLAQNPIPEDDHYVVKFHQTTETSALFSHLRLTINPSMETLIGIRFTRERKFASAVGRAECATRVIDGSCISQIAIGTENYRSGNIRNVEEQLTPRLSVRFMPSDSTSWHFSTTRGFKSGGVNAISYRGTDLEFEPEENWTNELGVRSHFFDSRLSVALTAFHSRFENLQVMAFNGLFFDVTNAAEAASYGLEIESFFQSEWRPLKVRLSAGWLKARYEKYRDAPAPISFGNGQTQDLSGEKIAYSPELTTTLAPTLTFNQGNFDWGFSLLMLYQASHYTDTDLDRITKVPSATTADVGAFIAHPKSGWRLQIGLKNASDLKQQEKILDTALFPGTFSSTQKPGRELYGSLRFVW